MNLLKRELSPILPEAWRHIDAEAARILRLNLAGRKLVDFNGPHGWGFGALNTGHLRILTDQPVEGIHIGIREVKPMIEVRSPILLELLELDLVGRGALDPDLKNVVSAAELTARFEDHTIFNGYPPDAIFGILESTPHAPLLVRDATDWPRALARGKEVLRAAGVDGPYSLALGPTAYSEVFSASEEGYPISKHMLNELSGGTLVRAPVLEGAVLLSTRGGDFELTVGQDFAIGFVQNDKKTVELYLTESFTFRVLEGAAAIALHRAPSSVGYA